MDFEHRLAFPARLLSKRPALMLPAVLNWIGEGAALVLATAFLAANPALLEPYALALLMQDFSPTPQFLLPFAPVLAFGLLVAIAWVLLSGLVGLWFCGICQQSAQAVPPSLANGLSFARSRLKRFAGAWLAVAAIATVVAGAVLLLAVPLIGLLASNPAVAVIGGMFLLFFAAAALLFFSVLFWLLPALVAFRGASGFGAFAEFYGVAKSRLPAVAVGFLTIAVVSFAVGQLIGLMGQLPIAGYAIAQLLSLPLVGWSAMVAALVILEK